MRAVTGDKLRSCSSSVIRLRNGVIPTNSFCSLAYPLTYAEPAGTRLPIGFVQVGLPETCAAEPDRRCSFHKRRITGSTSGLATNQSYEVNYRRDFKGVLRSVW